MNEIIPQQLADIGNIAMEGLQGGEMKAVDIIKSDHRKVEGLFKQFEQESNKRRKFALAEEICMELTVHAKYEEELIYPIVAEQDEDEEQEAEFEHELIKFMIAQIQDGGGAADKSLDPKVKVLKELVEHHVEEEETNVLPDLEDNEELQALSEKIMKRKQQLMTRMQKKESAAKSQAKGKSGARTGAKRATGKAAASKATSSRGARKGGASKGGSKQGGAKKASANGGRKATATSGRKPKAKTQSRKSSR